MEDGVSLYAIMKDFMHIGSPIIILMGVLIILHRNYAKVEDKINKDIGGIKIRIFPKIESNILTLHDLFFNVKNLIGVLCILTGTIFFFLTR
ncbi:MAG: hypothetical protein ABSB18_02910 [Candidatus Omnitrophota bacterium]